MRKSTIDAAKGKWRGIMMQLGMPTEFLTGKHGPCPLCGGKDRYRWDNKEGSGSYFCSGCGAGTGMQLAEKFTNQSFKNVARQIDDILGNKNLPNDRPAHQMSDDDRRAYLRKVGKMCKRIEQGSLVDLYLSTRGLDDTVYPSALRFIPDLNDGEGGVRPCMIGLIQAPDGSNVSLHRTFLGRGGLSKAEDMPNPRKVMPGSIPEGAAIRLSDWVSGPIGIAEGIETALAASRLFEIPVWAAINSTMLEKWLPPEGAEDITIFGDNDTAYGGQSAAFRLAHKLAVKSHDVIVKIPDTQGEDWNDVLLRRTKKIRAATAA